MMFKHVFRRGLVGFHRRSLFTGHRCQQNNVILLGSPGSGKTTIGKIVGSKLGRPVIDIDNDYLESHWNMPVSQKLSEVGSDGFVEAEGEALLGFQASDSIISLTGSNPMHPAAMEHMKKQGVCVFLDVPSDDIIERLEHMKVTRIVGQNDGVDMSRILKYRQQFYESSYDIRVLCEAEETPESIADKVIDAIDLTKNGGGHVSTRGAYVGEKGPSFNDVVLQGLAPDGGLYVPNGKLPSFSLKQWERLIGLSYPERALRILEPWIHHRELPPRELAAMIDAAYSIDNFNCHQVVPVVHLERNTYIMELFHGPTASFKDAALQLMPKFFLHALQQCPSDQRSKYLILVATSGDTGGAVLDGFSKLPASSGIDVMVLYPETGISSIQKAQMTNMPGENLHVLGVTSDFDFCQTTIKQIFNDTAYTNELGEQYGVKLRKCDVKSALLDAPSFVLSGNAMDRCHQLFRCMILFCIDLDSTSPHFKSAPGIAANSINWGRLLPQVVYHASSYLDLVQQGVISLGDPVDLCIPTGNFGNILAAHYVKEMGIPFHSLICASNVNNILAEFIHDGVYNLKSRDLYASTSPAIDILKSSNLERYLYHLTNGDTKTVRQWYQDLEDTGQFQIPDELLEKMDQTFNASWCHQELCAKTIEDTFKNTGYLLDTHTAISKCVADRFNDGKRPMLIASTAHHAKFAEEVLVSLNKNHSGEPETLLRELAKCNARPLPHSTLSEIILGERIHKRTCSNNINDITKNLEWFITRNHTLQK